MKKVPSLVILLVALFLLPSCMYTKSMLKYAEEGTARVSAGYKAKADMTESMMKYIAEANKDCGVKVVMVNGTPVTTVKECIRIQDVVAAIDRVQIVQPEPVKDVLSSAGDFVAKATPLAVPFVSAYYQYQINKDNQNANVKITESNNAMTKGMWDAYTGNFQNNSTTSNTSSSTTIEKENTSTSSTNTSNIETTTTSTSNIQNSTSP